MSQTNPLAVKSFLMETLSFVPINVHRCSLRDRYWGRADQPLVNFCLSLVTVLDVIAKVNSAKFFSCFQGGKRVKETGHTYLKLTYSRRD